MGRKFGWHSGTLKCQNANILGDLTINDDIIFSDVSAGRLGVTGGIDMQATTSAIGIDLGGTFSTSAINIDGTCGAAISLLGATTTKDIVLKNGESINNTTDGYVNTDGAFRISGVGGAGLASNLTLSYAETSAGAQTATMTNAVAAGNPSKWLNVYFGATKYLVPLFPSA